MYGVTKVVFATYMILVNTVLGPATGPGSLLLLNSVDLLLGIITAIAAVFWFARRTWAHQLIRFGSGALVLYELGRALGLEAGGAATASSIGEVVKTLAVLLLLVSAWLSANSSASEVYFNSDRSNTR